MMRYVFPVPAALRGRLLNYNRLYAYPAVPEAPPSDGFVILDSGAFGLAQRGRQIGSEHIRRLAQHYAAHDACDRFPIVGVAPDEYLNPAATISNWRAWHRAEHCPVAPVIQFTSETRLDLYAVHRQVQVYASHKPIFVLVSNPGLRAASPLIATLKAAVSIMRAAFPGAWLHFLGAGWDLADIRAWMQLQLFDSMDSIAYYTAAQTGSAWLPDNEMTWPDLACAHARAITQCLY